MTGMINGCDVKLDFLFSKETRNLYWNCILSDKMEDSHGDYVFFRARKDEFTKTIFSFFSLVAEYIFYVASVNHLCQRINCGNRCLKMIESTGIDAKNDRI